MISSNFNTGSIRQSIRFDARPAAVWALFATALGQANITGASCFWEEEVGGSFFLFDGYCTGTTLEREPPVLLVQEWIFREEHWPDSHVSKCRFEFVEEIGLDSVYCRIEFTQWDVPEPHLESLSNGWVRYYWTPMRALLGG
ncbi:hypothetical protein GC167_03970 [bacterium]|nr:hypothetical protein [bacterium]